MSPDAIDQIRVADATGWSRQSATISGTDHAASSSRRGEEDAGDDHDVVGVELGLRELIASAPNTETRDRAE